MHESTLRILEIIKRSRHHFSDVELADFVLDIRRTENAALLPLMKPKTRTVYSFEESDPNYLEFQLVRKQLISIHNEDYISDIVRILNVLKLADDFDLRQFHKKSIPAFYDAITQIIPPETLIDVARKYTQHKLRLAA